MIEGEEREEKKEKRDEEQNKNERSKHTQCTPSSVKEKWHCLGPGMLRGHWLRLTARRNAISGRPLAKLTARIHYCMTVGIFNMYFAYYLSTRLIGNWPFVWGLFMVAWGCMIGRSRNCPNLPANFEYYPTHT